MKLVFDIHHSADVNFFKNIIKILVKEGYEIEVILRKRGNIVSIFQKELPDITYRVHGKHYSSTHKKIFGLIKRDIELLYYFNKHKYHASVSGGFEICSISRILGKPSIAFVDDYEYTLLFNLAKFLSNYLIMPDCIPVTGDKIYKYKGIKELAYLHPNFFKPNIKILDNYNLKSNEYVFIREIAATSLNYHGKQSRLHEIVQYLRQIGLKVVVSLENKSLISKFENECIILKEPLDDLYSIINSAAFMISSGDTMARESCLVGTPVIYTGSRDMAVNKELIEKECMFAVTNNSDIIDVINYIIKNDVKSKVKETINYKLKYEWDNVTEVVANKIMVLVR